MNRGPEESWDASYEAVRLQHIVDVARLTTPAERFRWLEEAFDALAPVVLRARAQISTDEQNDCA